MFIYRSPGSHVLVARTASEFLAMMNNDLYVTLMNGYVESKYTSFGYAVGDPYIHSVCAVAELVSCTYHNQCLARHDFQLRNLKRLVMLDRTFTYDKLCFAEIPEGLCVLSAPDNTELVGIAKELLAILRSDNQRGLYPLKRQERELTSIVNIESGCVSGIFTSATIEKIMNHLENAYNDMYAQVTTNIENIHRVAVCARDWSNYTKV